MLVIIVKCKMALRIYLIKNSVHIIKIFWTALARIYITCSTKMEFKTLHVQKLLERQQQQKESLVTYFAVNNTNNAGYIDNQWLLPCFLLLKPAEEVELRYH